jgi:asparagine synthase (glutamine-hydrolysing)
MCGIAGIMASGQHGELSEPLLRRMCNAMSHRGPDDEGYYFEEGAALGMRRLSIIDISAGHQPIFNETGDIVVVFNGEIYNYPELRADLLRRGHYLKTHSDTETIVHLYEDYGNDCVRHLRGMFGFALWDNRNRKLLLARDRVGIKQVYYRVERGKLCFASEIKCLLEDESHTPRLNDDGVAAYLTFLYAPHPETMFAGIHEVPPAHTLSWQNGQVQLRRYWRLEYNIDESKPERYYVEGLREKLASAVRSHMIADVPVGAFLSGGIDSGLIVGLMSQWARPVRTFTVGFEGNYGYYDERKEAAIVAKRYETEHHEFVARPNVVEILPKLVRALDQPLADSSAIPNYYISQLARSKVKVALSGMGGDEMAGGYERYAGVLLGQRLRKIPLAIRKTLAAAAMRLPDIGGTGRFSSSRLKRLFSSLQGETWESYASLLTVFSPEEQSRLFSDRLAPAAKNAGERVRQEFESSGSVDPVNQMLFADLNGYLVGDLLPLTDRMSMAHSLEVRVPLLDHELLEFAAIIPPELKIKKMQKKYILKQAAVGLLPDEILHREKRGFSIPLAFWLRNELKPLVQDVLSIKEMRRLGYFRPTEVERIVKEHFSSRANHENKIWALLMFSLWHRSFIEARVTEPWVTL